MYSVPSSIAAEADLRRTNLTWGEATLLLGHAGDPRAAAGDTTNVGQTNWSTPATRVSPSPAREPTRPVGRHRPVRSTMTVSLRHRLPLKPSSFDGFLPVRILPASTIFPSRSV